VKYSLLLASPLTVLAGVVAIPVMLANGDPPSLVACAPDVASIDTILATIRRIESGDNYQATNRASSASGAYQIIDSTWDGYAGHQRAVDAPPDIQDAKATEMVAAILNRHHDVAAVPVVWYIGHLPAPDSSEWDSVPAPEAGNRLTPRQYQQRWMTQYTDLAGKTMSAPTGTTATATPSDATPLPTGCVTGIADETLPGDWALPGPRSVLDATSTQLDNPHHDYPAWDWLIPIGTPIYAIRAGTVAATYAWPHNWWEQGCTTSGLNGCATCGIGVTIVDDLGIRWTYCHGSDLHVTPGSHVKAASMLISSGNTGRSGAPHLHLEIRTPGGVQRCPQPVVAALYRTSTGIDPRTLPTSGCSF
jgi:murein DD-endopeptidase MepM/ murein hydrolase activator NlpD